jgi:hypothetical protein
MTTTTPTEPSYKDAKAQAKAAKAYAKAQRPFYKKKRFFFPVAIATVAIRAYAAQGGSSDNGAAVNDSGSTTSSSTADAGSQSNPYKVGQTIELEGTQYTVTEASTQGKIGGAFGEKADGTFVVVDLTIENKKDETKTFMDEAATFVASDGTKYEGSDAAIYLENSLWLQDMQPDLPTDGQLVFDVPPAKVAGGILMVEDLFGGGEANIALGLK